MANKKEITKSRIGEGGTYYSLPAGQSLMQEEEDIFLSVPELLETFEFGFCNKEVKEKWQ